MRIPIDMVHRIGAQQQHALNECADAQWPVVPTLRQPPRPRRRNRWSRVLRDLFRWLLSSRA